MASTRSSINSFRILVFCLIITGWPSALHAQEGLVKIGVLSFRSEDMTLRRWEKTADYLSEKIPGYTFEMIPLNYPEMNNAVKNKSIDFVLTNTGHYVSLEARLSIIRLVTLVKSIYAKNVSVFGGVIFARADRNDINNLKDLEGKSFLAVGKNSLGGFIVALEQFHRQGMNIFKDLNISFNGMPHDEVVFKVLDGHADAGTVRTSVLESLADEGSIDMADIKILKQVHTPGFPFVHSTSLYPEWPFSKLAHTDEDLAKKVVIALLQIQPEHAAAKTGHYSNWAVPLNYQPVHHMMKELRIGPYVETGPFTLMDVFHKYLKTIIFASVGIILMLTYMMIRLIQLNKTLRTEISERKRAEEEKEMIEVKLHRSQKMEAIGLMAGGVAHDLNNILSGITSYPELILLDLPHESPLRKPIETIKDSGMRAASVVSDLLTVAQGIASSREVINLNRIAQEYLCSAEFKKIEATNPSISFKTNLDSNLMKINCSTVHIKKIVMNLVMNATEAIDGEGIVTLLTRNQYVDHPIKGYEDICKGEYTVLTVSDNGSGISKNDLERIFEPFYTKKVLGKSGTGLGLAVVWNTVKGHDGYIDIKSSRVGTSFEIYLPITREEEVGGEKTISFDQLFGRGEKILVVDDEERQRDIASLILAKLHYTPESAASGEAAVEYLKKNSVDLVILDMIMEPGICGRKTYERMVRIHPGQKALIVSGFAETEEVKKAQELGAGKFIKKPYTLESLGMAIQEILQS